MYIDEQTMREIDSILNDYIRCKSEEQKRLGKPYCNELDKAIKIRILLNNNFLFNLNL